MKKLILLFVLISNFAFTQSQSEIETIAKSYFENNFVQKTFKDPYSYELKKIWSHPITNESSLSSKISQLQVLSSSSSFSKKERKQFLETANQKKSELEKLSPEEKSTIIAYAIYLDTYGANSYGNKVLGRYVMTVDTSGQIIGEITELK